MLHEGQAQRGDQGMPLVLLTTDAPASGTSGHRALQVMRGAGRPVFDLVELLSAEDQARLRAYATAGRSAAVGEQPGGGRRSGDRSDLGA